MDIEILLWLQGLREAAGPAVEAIANFITELPLSPLTYAIPLLLFWCFDKRAGRYLVIAFGVSTGLLNTIKVFACVPRPWIVDSRVVPSEAALDGATGYSFPSGHSQITCSVYGGAGWCFRKYRWPLIVGAVLTLLVAFTRCYLGVHTPQDVIVGILVGVVSLWFAGWLLKAFEGGRLDARVVLGVCLAFVAIMVVVTAVKPYPEIEGVDTAKIVLDTYKALGLTAGIALALFLENRYVGFSNDCAVRDKVIRVAISLALVVVIYLACQLLKSAGLSEVYGFSRSFFCVMAGLWVGPAIAQMLAAKFPAKQ